MVHIKAHEVESYLSRPDDRYQIVLLYGPDSGLISERADQIALQSKVNLDDPFCYIKMDGDTLNVPSAVVEEAHTISMFGDRRLIRFRVGSLRNAVDTIKPLQKVPPDNAMIVILAGDLQKNAPLRKLVENMQNGIALPCYQDEARALDTVIDQELELANLTMDRETRNYLKNFLGGDRLASRGEVKKLCLYCQEKTNISIDDVDDVVGDVAANAIDDIVDAACTGNLTKLDDEFARFVGLGSPPFILLNSALRHFQMLHIMRSRHESGSGTIKTIVDRARPPVYFKRKNAVTQTLIKWNGQSLMAASNRIADAIRDSRLNAQMELPIVRTCLTAIALMARQRWN